MSQDTTTTTEDATVQAQETAQPENAETQAVQADDKSADTNQTSEVETITEDQTGTSDENAEILDWAEKKGIKTDDPISILKMARESETKMHSATTEVKKLRDAVQTIGENEGLGEDINLLNRLKVTDFFQEIPEAQSLAAEMAQVINERPYLANDLKTAYEVAGFRTNKVVSEAQIEASRKEKLAQVAKAEIAAPPNTSATTRETPKGVTEEDIGKMSATEYVEFKKNTGFDPFAV